MNIIDRDLVVSAVTEATDALLVALVALQALPEAEVPLDALDCALREDEAYQAARRIWRVVFDDLGDVLDRDALWLELDEKMNAVVTAGTDVGFRLGLAMAAACTGRPS